MQKRENWERLRGIALIVPDDDILPLRAVYAPHGAAGMRKIIETGHPFSRKADSHFHRKRTPVLMKTDSQGAS
jgi:hypothetical protein